MEQYWLVKSEPDVFSFVDLQNRPQQRESWDGVRNYQARNYMRDEMKLGHKVLFYHSNCDTPGVVGIAEVVRESYPDHTSWDPSSQYFDPKSKPEAPRWFMVDLKFFKSLPKVVTLAEMRGEKKLQHMKIIQKGSRLSVGPVSIDEFQFICDLANKKD